MIFEQIDLYKHFNIKKKSKEKGILTVYARDNNEEVNISRTYPGILICPGGGYFFTSFREAEPIALKCIENNIQSFVLEYSCVNDGDYPAPILEGYLALKYIEENITRFHLEKNKLGIMGFSAGGHLAGLLSNNYIKDEFKNLSLSSIKLAFGAYIYPVNYFTRNGSHQDSFINLTKNNRDLIAKLDFDTKVNEDSPAAFIVSTYEDNAVGYKNSLSLANSYSLTKVPFELHVFAKGDHGMSLGDENVYKTTNLDLNKKNFSKWFNLFLNFLKGLNITINE